MFLKDSKGFTIIEVMIAMAIFAIGILAVAKMQVSSTGYNTKSRIYTEAASFAAGQVEEMMNSDYAVLADSPSAGITDGIIYNIKWDVEPDPTDPHDLQFEVKRIHVTVTWPTRDSNPNSKFEATYYKAVTY